MPESGAVSLQALLGDLTGGDDERAENSIPLIVELGAAALPPLVALTRASEADARWWAARALAALPHARAAHLLPLLEDAAPEVRAAAALALREHPEAEAVPALVKILDDEQPLAANAAMTALIKIGKPATVALIECASNLNMPVRARSLALRALSEIRDHRAIPVLMKALAEDSALLDYWAQIGLERLGLDMVYIKP